MPRTYLTGGISGVNPVTILRGRCSILLRFARPKNEMIFQTAYFMKEGDMSQVPVENSDRVVRARIAPSRTWAGMLVDSAHRVTHYLHLSAFPCAHCNGPVIAGQMGTREDDIARETEFREIGAVCLFCGRRSAAMPEPSMEHRFRPVE